MIDENFGSQMAQINTILLCDEYKYDFGRANILNFGGEVSIFLIDLFDDNPFTTAEKANYMLLKWQKTAQNLY